MKRTLKRKWTDALESGQYMKGKNTLRKSKPGAEPTSCCLGVLMEVLMDDPNYRHRISRIDEPDLEPYESRYNFDGFTTAAYIPGSLGDEIGLPKEIQSRLAELNDGSLDFNFLQLAAVIERMVEEEDY